MLCFFVSSHHHHHRFIDLTLIIVVPSYFIVSLLLQYLKIKYNPHSKSPQAKAKTEVPNIWSKCNQKHLRVVTRIKNLRCNFQRRRLYRRRGNCHQTSRLDIENQLSFFKLSSFEINFINPIEALHGTEVRNFAYFVFKWEMPQLLLSGRILSCIYISCLKKSRLQYWCSS